VNASEKNLKPASAMATKSRHLTDREDLISWYGKVKRPLPWRADRDPYRIWISEVMLQQTTVAAVIPYYLKFLARFPDLKTLAQSELGDVIEMWAGLGYYSRARNLHKSSQALASSGFHQTAAELQLLPGFGPYTSRAVASLAFGQRTGVLDGNVIRVLSRKYGIKSQWWKPKARAQLQILADALAQTDRSSELNQGMMELGATVCTPKSPSCLICPWVKTCVARRQFAIDKYPLSKPRRQTEIWQWSPKIIVSRNRVLLIANTYSPFLKSHFTLPGTARQLEKAPKKFDFRGGVTHHDIFVTVKVPKSLAGESNVVKKDMKWVSLDQLKKEIPASLIRKAISAGLAKRSL
jgi:A/G-specific adenine glycosylase